ncbi:MAG: hypothetical protein CSB55_07670 [Candidatus Cloacimonadota bacterium]|nr:MAG: hypothetical protein CSB55_07670 [Candidatus Cloacimonadota bacterium]
MKKIFVLILLSSVFVLSALEKSTFRKAFLSAILPGTGEYLNGNKTRAAVFIAAEAAVWLSWLKFSNEEQMAEDSYKRYARDFAGYTGNNDDFYSDMHKAFSSESVIDENIQALRNYWILYKEDPAEYEIQLDAMLKHYEGNEWHWESHEAWRHYRVLRQRNQNFEMRVSFAFSAALINRLISFIDVFIVSVNADNTNLSVAPDFKNECLRLSYEYKF